MMTNTEIKIKGLQILTKSLGLVEAERFVALIQQEPFDYTKWRDGLFEDLSVEEISHMAMELRKKKAEPNG
ncbi:MAG: hypothetical protein U9P10_04695 [Thermodesulfobacteriota bacterium]|nr:hypothetical protein [Thermodesulfobacteriota bacterium]